MDGRALEYHALTPTTFRCLKEKEPQHCELIELRFPEQWDRKMAAAVLFFFKKKSFTLRASQLVPVKAGFISWGILCHQPPRYLKEKENQDIGVYFSVYEESQERLVVDIWPNTAPSQRQRVVVETQSNIVSVKRSEVDESLSCPEGCGKTFQSRQGRDNHFCEPKPCPKGCGKIFRSQGRLARHRCNKSTSKAHPSRKRKTSQPDPECIKKARVEARSALTSSPSDLAGGGCQ